MPLDPDLNEFSTISPVLTTFNFTDIAEGTGIVKFYLAQSISTGTLSPILIADSTVNTTEEVGGSTSGRIKILAASASVDFDLTPFNLPKTLRGTGTIEFEAISGTGTGTLTFQLKKVSGGVPSNVGTATVINVTTAADIFLGRIVIASPVHFAKGDFFRLTITALAQQMTFGTDPQNNLEGSIANTKTTLSVPFDLPNQ